MYKILTGAAASLLCSTALATAGGVERAVFNPGFLFEDGNYVELSFGSVAPTVSGSVVGIGSGDMAQSFTLLSGAMKQQVTDNLALGLVIDQPAGANVAYPTGTFYPFSGATAEVTTTQVTGIGLYSFSDNFSAYAGLRAALAKGQVANIPLPSPPFPVASYDMQTTSNVAYGYLVGAAYERPEIALRVALTYISDITHDFTATDTLGPGADFDTTIPQSWNLDFQTGVAANTLVFGSIRWRDWSEFNIIARGIVPLSTDNRDTVTYSLGVGRKFTETLSGAASITYEPPVGGAAGNLSPTDGYKSLTLAAIYTMPAGPKITVGATYGQIGDSFTRVGPATSSFTDNHYAGIGVKVGWNF